MLYSHLAPYLLNGHLARRQCWAPGRSIFLGRAEADRIRSMSLDQKLRAMVSLHLLTPHGAYRYLSHSIDRRAGDWEVVNERPQGYGGRRGEDA